MGFGSFWIRYSEMPIPNSRLGGCWLPLILKKLDFCPNLSLKALPILNCFVFLDNKQSSITSKALNNSNLAIQNLDEKKIGLSPGNNKELYPKVNSTKPKRRSIKEYKREKLKQSADKNFDTDQVPLSANVQSKALQRKQREQNKVRFIS